MYFLWPEKLVCDNFLWVFITKTRMWCWSRDCWMAALTQRTRHTSHREKQRNALMFAAIQNSHTMNRNEWSFRIARAIKTQRIACLVIECVAYIQFQHFVATRNLMRIDLSFGNKNNLKIQRETRMPSGAGPGTTISEHRQLKNLSQLYINRYRVLIADIENGFADKCHDNKATRRKRSRVEAEDWKMRLALFGHRCN